MRYQMLFVKRLDDVLSYTLKRLPSWIGTSIVELICKRKLTSINEIRLHSNSFLCLIADSKNIKTDIVIVGCGVSGLYCALNLPKEKNIVIVTKSEASESDSFLAQGGICVQRDDGDYDSFYEDTMRAGHYENNPTSVEIMIRSSRKVISDLVDFGVKFGEKFKGLKVLEFEEILRKLSCQVIMNIHVKPLSYSGEPYPEDMMKKIIFIMRTFFALSGVSSDSIHGADG